MTTFVSGRTDMSKMNLPLCAVMQLQLRCAVGVTQHTGTRLMSELVTRRKRKCTAVVMKVTGDLDNMHEPTPPTALMVRDST